MFKQKKYCSGREILTKLLKHEPFCLLHDGNSNEIIVMGKIDDCAQLKIFENEAKNEEDKQKIKTFQTEHLQRASYMYQLNTHCKGVATASFKIKTSHREARRVPCSISTHMFIMSLILMLIVRNVLTI